MYGIYANIWGVLMVNVTIYTIHGSYGYIHIYIYKYIYINIYIYMSDCENPRFTERTSTNLGRSHRLPHVCTIMIYGKLGGYRLQETAYLVFLTISINFHKPMSVEYIFSIAGVFTVAHIYIYNYIYISFIYPLVFFGLSRNFWRLLLPQVGLQGLHPAFEAFRGAWDLAPARVL